MRLDHHLALLSHPRTLALKEAVFSQVKPGDRVLDAGTGSGILAVWAAQAGASAVLAVDREHLGLAAALAEANGVSGRIKFSSADLSHFSSDGLFDGLLAMIYENDPRRDEKASAITARLMRDAIKPGGWCVPDSVVYEAQLVDWPAQSLAGHKAKQISQIDSLGTRLGLDLGPFAEQIRECLSMDLFPTRRIDGTLPREGQALSRNEAAIKVAYLSGKTNYDDNLRLAISEPGDATAVVWTQRLLHQQRLLFANESISWLTDVVTVKPGTVVEIPLDSSWRLSNRLRMRPIKEAK